MLELDFIVSEVLEELAFSNTTTSNEQMHDVLYAYNTECSMGHKLKMIAWDRK